MESKGDETLEKLKAQARAQRGGTAATNFHSQVGLLWTNQSASASQREPSNSPFTNYQDHSFSAVGINARTCTESDIYHKTLIHILK